MLRQLNIKWAIFGKESKCLLLCAWKARIWFWIDKKCLKTTNNPRKMPTIKFETRRAITASLSAPRIMKREFPMTELQSTTWSLQEHSKFVKLSCQVRRVTLIPNQTNKQPDMSMNRANLKIKWAVREIRHKDRLIQIMDVAKKGTRMILKVQRKLKKLGLIWTLQVFLTQLSIRMWSPRIWQLEGAPRKCHIRMTCLISWSTLLIKLSQVLNPTWLASSKNLHFANSKTRPKKLTRAVSRESSSRRIAETQSLHLLNQKSNMSVRNVDRSYLLAVSNKVTRVSLLNLLNSYNFQRE